MSDTVTPFAPIFPGDPSGGGGIVGPIGGSPFTPGPGGGAGLGGQLTLPSPPIPPKAPAAPTTAVPNVNSTRSPNDGKDQAGETLWMRKWKLSVGAASGSTTQSAPGEGYKGGAMDLSLLDFEFNIDMPQLVVPVTAHIKIWNVGLNLIQQMNKELTQIYLEAGYLEPSKQYGVLFHGQIEYFKYGRANATDKFVEITATSYNTAVNAAVVNTWLPAGYQTMDAISAALAAMSPYGIQLGQVPDDLDKSKKPRGRLMFGMARDFLRDIERTERGHFFTDKDGKLHFLRDDEALKMGSETIPILNSRTGLIDVPTSTLDGAAEVQCLLNPRITPGTRIKVNNKDIAGTTWVNKDSNLTDDAFRLSNQEFNVAPDGIYTVGHVRHSGQNRGNPWFTTIVTKKVDAQPGIKTSAA